MRKCLSTRSLRGASRGARLGGLVRERSPGKAVSCDRRAEIACMTVTALSSRHGRPCEGKLITIVDDDELMRNALRLQIALTEGRGQRLRNRDSHGVFCGTQTSV